LGESHYNDWDGEPHVLDQDSTRCCVKDAVNRVGGARFWPIVEQALLNQERVDGWAPRGQDVWHEGAFYNFVQSPVKTANTPPTKKQFEDSAAPYLGLLEELRPERVIVCGKRLWSRMPETDLFLRDDVQAYCLQDGTPVWCLAIRHPSRAFNWRQWHPLISAFLVDPDQAVHLAPIR
jgi:hypothetical protein